MSPCVNHFCPKEGKDLNQEEGTAFIHLLQKILGMFAPCTQCWATETGGKAETDEPLPGQPAARWSLSSYLLQEARCGQGCGLGASAATRTGLQATLPFQSFYFLTGLLLMVSPKLLEKLTLYS